MNTNKQVNANNKDLGACMASVAVELGCKYTLKGAVAAPEELFKTTALLPAIMRRADQLCSFCLGYGLGVEFGRADGTMLGISVTFDDKVSNALRLLCATDVLIEIIQNSPNQQQVALDELLLD